MRPFTLLIKPASADCNLRCEYCFYLEKCSLYPDTARHRMSDDVLERLVKSYMATDQPGYGFGWQGGEPTLMGIDFFENVVTLQQKYGRPGAVVSNGLQTNATRITRDLASHFSKYEFLLGCSLDGPPAIHNQYRKTIDGAPTHQLVLNGLNVLKEHQVEFNILTLVSQSNVSHPEAVYRYLKDEGFQFHQYIPCVEFDKKNSPLPFAVNGREWGEFLCRLFDVWYPEDCYSISIRHFDAILFKLVEDRSTVCHMGKRCNEYLVVEHNGDVYPCDFFVEKNLKLGNIMDNEWEDLLGSPILEHFAAKKHQWNSACTACELLGLCNGDCLKHRMYNNNSPQTLSWLCEGWQHFLSHTRERFESLAAEIRRHRFQTQNQPLSPVNSYGQTKKVARNAPCPCGSGKKYKKCCGARNT